MITRALLVVPFVVALAACVGGPASDPDGSGTPARDDAPTSTGGTTGGGTNGGGTAKTPVPTSGESSGPCAYDAPPPANPPECPKTWGEACKAGNAVFVCPKADLDCWYANVGDESAPGCYAHGLLRCREVSSTDGGTRLSGACAQ